MLHGGAIIIAVLHARCAPDALLKSGNAVDISQGAALRTYGMATLRAFH